MLLAMAMVLVAVLAGGALFMSGFLDRFLLRSEFTEHGALDQTSCRNKAKA